MSEYTCVKSNECTCGKPNDNTRVVSVLNYGAFIASAEIYYDYQGKQYNFYDLNILVLQEFRVNVPIDATNVMLYVWASDLFRGQYLLFKNTYPVANDSCLLLLGVSFAAQYKEIPCTSPGVMQNILPPGAIVPPQSLDIKCNQIKYDKCLYKDCKFTIECCCANNIKVI